MKKFNWKSHKFIGSVLTVVLLGLGVANPAVVNTIGTEVLCEAVKCDA